MKFFCFFIILMSYVQLQMAGPAYPPSPPYNSAGYPQGQAYSTASDTYNTAQYATGQAYYTNNAASSYNPGQAYSAGGGAYNSNNQAYLSGVAGANYNSGNQAYSSGTAGSSYNSGQSSNAAGASSNAGRTLEGQLLDIMVPQVLFEDFEYVPTKEGYRFSYKLADGTTHEEMGIIPNSGADNQDNGRTGMRPRGMLKSRKLSPKSLQSLAG